MSVAQFTPDGRDVVTATVNGWSYAQAGGFLVPIHLDAKAKNVWVCHWDAQSGRPISPPVKLPVRAWRVVFSPDCWRVVTSLPHFENTDQPQTQVWDVATGQAVSAAPFQHGGNIWSAAFSSDGRFVVTVSRDHTARVWDVETGKPITPPLEHREDVMDAVFAAGGRLVVTLSGDTPIWRKRRAQTAASA